ncbi:RecD/TraA family helicase RecD [Gottschalkia acidurici 9a]|uniref:ATP-dependent RecD2 DNA helicase n=1 Tax=Gottschalkia acidurici (strain ATCC 7906 / DSM 604 / BCRC 14475 / CIP 104303 / KCTC 5404 / NCIMB 10678 / 9a) TaxID=1128398 RepID=K0AY55_GOTA9|nr:ATP-dependent RecD-like DNA helicase [Gottschalkia acidurici]AFS77316.1 RecD/TraA family helicase RecD [Gottschalkia acidurici 9a]
MITLQGDIEEIIFHNEDNGYTVAILGTEDDVVTIVGNIPLIRDGESLKVHGTIINHPTYGEQLKVEAYELIAPATINGIIKYLSSGLIPGIGPKTAERIVERFGTDSLDILQYNPNRLKEIEGIGDKKLEKIVASFEEQRELKDIMVFLQQYDITPALGIKIYKKYGTETIEKVQENPYRLSEEIIGIGFKLADKIAKSMGVEPNSSYRISAGIKFCLTGFASEGHTYAPRQELIHKCSRLLEVDNTLVEEGLMDLALRQEVQLENFDDEICVYYMPYYYAETNVSKKIIELSQSEIKKLEVNIENEIEELESENNISLADNQKEAIRQSVENGLLVITGGPGTGKTTTINTIIQLFESQDLKIHLAAPTGRAAKRMSEATGREAKTIHRLLEYGFVDESIGMIFSKDEGTPLETDVIIIDEMSMVDILLMNNLLKAIMPGTRVILVGDTDQLPSVGAGNVLKDIIESKIVKVVKLDEIFRQAQESMIIVNAHKINKGEHPKLNVKDKDFFFLNGQKPEVVVKTVIDLAKERLPKYNGYDPIKDIQILSCSRKGDVGVNILNDKLQEALNPKARYKSERKIGDQILRVGDKIMQIKNNYNTKWKLLEGDRITQEGEGVFNGDFGLITDIDEEENELVVLFDDNREVIYNFSQLDEIRLAYATTVHKSQGSEFPVVIMPIYWGPPMLLMRNLLYTAITRAKELVVLVGDQKCLGYMINNNKITKRYSGLNKRLFKVFEYLMR